MHTLTTCRHLTRDLACFILVVLILGACEGQPNEQQAQATRTHLARPNIVFILIDTLRKDHLSAYGYPRETTPFLDSLGSAGLLFENTVAQAPWTAPSVASIFTSKYPSQVWFPQLLPARTKDAEKPSHPLLHDDSLTLAEILQGNGYSTGGIFSNIFVSTNFGFTQGFETQVFFNSHDRTEPPLKIKTSKGLDRLVDAAIQFIDTATSLTTTGDHEPPHPFFLYLHSVDVHSPTIPPPPYDSLYPTLDSTMHESRHFFWDYKEAKDLGSRDFKLYRSHKIALYDGAIRFSDDQIRRLIDHLKERGLYDNTVILVTSDHGEMFWEHSEYEKNQMDYRSTPTGFKGKGYGISHAHTMFNELLQVPLIIYGKGVPTRRVERQVRSIDIVPTLLELVGIDTSKYDFEGINLLVEAKADESTAAAALSENVVLGYLNESLQDSRYHYMRYSRVDPSADPRPNTRREFLFDKRADPSELTEISEEFPGILVDFREIVLSRGVSTHPSAEIEVESLDEDTKRELRALGYL